MRWRWKARKTDEPDLPIENGSHGQSEEGDVKAVPDSLLHVLRVVEDVAGPHDALDLVAVVPRVDDGGTAEEGDQQPGVLCAVGRSHQPALVDQSGAAGRTACVKVVTSNRQKSRIENNGLLNLGVDFFFHF